MPILATPGRKVSQAIRALGSHALVVTSMSRKNLPRRNRRRRGGGRGNGGVSASSGVPRPMRPYTMSRSFVLGSVSPVATDAGGSFVAILTQLPNVAEFTNLFQEYKIVRAAYEVTFLPGPSERYTPVFWYGNFVSDAFIAPTSLDDVLQTSGQRKFAFGPDKRTVRVGFAPKVRTGDSVQQLRRSPWIAMASPGSTHVGLWYWIQFFNTGLVTGSSISITATYVVQFRGTK